jgi:hypothetical protein
VVTAVLEDAVNGYIFEELCYEGDGEEAKQSLKYRWF